MANYTLDEKMVSGMSDGDMNALLSLYLHRCLTPELIVKYPYSCDEISSESADLRLNAMILDKLIEVVSYGENKEALFLTSFGVKTVTGLYSEQLMRLYKPGSGKKLPSYWDLKMHPANINHQIHLNRFGLEFERYARGLIEYEYYDEKFMPPASDFMMPDGMISLPDRLLFLEMDMGTESIKRLAQKWDSYRMFLNSPKAYYQDRPITMFFILDGIRKLSLRQKTTTRSLMTYLGGRVNRNFEAYFEPPEICHEIIRTRYLSAGTELSADEESVLTILKSKYGFQISKPAFLREIGLPSSYYVKRLNDKGKIAVVGDRPQEFILEIWLDRRFSIFQSLASNRQVEAKLREMAGREVPYLLVVPSIIWANKIPLIIKSTIPEKVFFTTPERLNVRTDWHKALFRIDQIKNLTHFEDDSLSTPIHEKRLTKL